MTVKQLKKYLSNLPEDMNIGLIDSTTDDFHDRNYSIPEDNLIVDECCEDEGSDPCGTMLFIYFDNKLNENPIN